MIASYANFGPGIAFLLAQVFVGLVVLVWIVAWLPHGFRLRRSGDQDRVRAITLRVFAALVVAMICFPPLRCTGIWLAPDTRTPVLRDLAEPYDRFYFGYIPTYAWIGHCLAMESPATRASVSLEPDATYYLDAIGWTVEWWLLFGQIGITFLFAFPFLAARDDRYNAEPSPAPDPAAEPDSKSESSPPAR